MAVDEAFEELLRKEKEANANHGVHEQEEEGKDGEDATTTATDATTTGMASPPGGRVRANRRGNADPQP